jgi:hypothetical protein
MCLEIKRGKLNLLISFAGLSKCTTNLEMCLVEFIFAIMTCVLSLIYAIHWE